jgi:hypothetical protein
VVASVGVPFELDTTFAYTVPELARLAGTVALPSLISSYTTFRPLWNARYVAPCEAAGVKLTDTVDPAFGAAGDSVRAGKVLTGSWGLVSGHFTMNCSDETSEVSGFA